MMNAQEAETRLGPLPLPLPPFFHFFSFVLSDYKPTNQPINRTYGK